MHVRNYLPVLTLRKGEVVATFGAARLIRTPEHKYELRGGSRADRTAAKEWISLFRHDVVVREVSV